MLRHGTVAGLREACACVEANLGVVPYIHFLQGFGGAVLIQRAILPVLPLEAHLIPQLPGTIGAVLAFGVPHICL